MKKKTALLLLVLLSLGQLGWTQPTQPTPTVRACAYENAPKIYTDESGTVTGFWPDLLNAIAAKEGWTLSWQHGSWDDCLGWLKENQVDVVPDMGWTEARSQIYDFSAETVLTSWTRLYVPAGSQVSSILDLEGKRIAGLKGSFNMDGPEGIKDLVGKFGLHATFVEMENYTQVFEALDKGTVDAGITNKDFGNLNEANYHVVRTSILFQPARIQFAFTQDAGLTPYLIERIDADMQAYKTDPNSIYFSALDQYLGASAMDPGDQTIPGWLRTLGLGGIGLILFLLAVGIVSRIQVRRRTAELEKSETRYETLARISPVGIFRTDARGATTYVNEAWCTISGLAAEAALGNGWLTAVHPDDRVRLNQGWREATSRQATSTSEYRFRHQDGPIAWVMGQAIQEVDADGQVVGYVGTITDITERKRAEEEIRQRAEELTAIHHTAQQLQAVQTPEALSQTLIQILEKELNYELGAVLLVDADGETMIPFAVSDQGQGEAFVMRDKAYLASRKMRVGQGITGWVAQTGQSARVGDVTQDPRYTAMRTEIRSELCVPLRSGDEILGVVNTETTAPDAYTESDQRLLETIAAQIVVALQNARLLEQVQAQTNELEHRVHERTAQLQEANKELESFSYSVSHDLRAPLRAISGFSEIIARRHRADLKPEGQHYVDNIIQASARMGLLIDDLLTYSRLGRTGVRREPVSLADLMQEISTNMGSLVRESHGTLILTPNLPTVMGDQTLLNQIFTNLLENALKYHQPDAPPQIVIDLHDDETDASFALLRVTDNGIGIAPEHQDKIFNIFQRLHSDEAYAGTGIGLSTVKKAVDLLGGQIWVESQVGKGSTFWVKLPKE